MMQMHGPCHPGDILLGYMEGIEEETGNHVTTAEMAQALGISESAVARFIEGEEPVTADLSRRLAIVFGNTDEEFWYTLQFQYDLAQERRRTPSITGLRILWPKDDFGEAAAIAA